MATDPDRLGACKPPTVPLLPGSNPVPIRNEGWSSKPESGDRKPQRPIRKRGSAERVPLVDTRFAPDPVSWVQYPALKRSPGFLSGQFVAAWEIACSRLTATGLSSRGCPASTVTCQRPRNGSAGRRCARLRHTLRPSTPIRRRKRSTSRQLSSSAVSPFAWPCLISSADARGWRSNSPACRQQTY